MAKRYTDTDKWKDDWYVELCNDHRIIWQWLIDNCNHAGICKRSIGVLNRFCNTNITESELLRVMDGRVIPVDNNWFIPNFLKFQYPTFKNKQPAVISVIKELEKTGYYKLIPKSFSDDFLSVFEHLPNGSGIVHEEFSNGLGTVAEQLPNSSITVKEGFSNSSTTVHEQLDNSCQTIKDKDKDKDINTGLTIGKVSKQEEGDKKNDPEVKPNTPPPKDSTGKEGNFLGDGSETGLKKYIKNLKNGTKGQTEGGDADLQGGGLYAAKLRQHQGTSSKQGGKANNSSTG